MRCILITDYFKKYSLQPDLNELRDSACRRPVNWQAVPQNCPLYLKLFFREFWRGSGRATLLMESLREYWLLRYTNFNWRYSGTRRFRDLYTTVAMWDSRRRARGHHFNCSNSGPASASKLEWVRTLAARFWSFWSFGALVSPQLPQKMLQ